jgi:8-amino-7-oxononanoate synthase
LATKLIQGSVVVFKHNNFIDLENKINQYKTNSTNRIVIAIEGIYSMGGDIAPKEIDNIATKHNAILIVDEAHSSGVIGDNLLGWFDYYHIKPRSNHIKMGTLGKAYGSYGAYILSSKSIITFLENRAKAIIYTTAPSLFDIALGYENLKYIIKHKKKLSKKIKLYQQIIIKNLDIKVDALIVPIVVNNNQKVLQIQKQLIDLGYIVGAIRQPTVSQAIVRLILKLDIKRKDMIKVVKKIKGFIDG